MCQTVFKYFLKCTYPAIVTHLFQIHKKRRKIATIWTALKCRCGLKTSLFVRKLKRTNKMSGEYVFSNKLSKKFSREFFANVLVSRKLYRNWECRKNTLRKITNRITKNVSLSKKRSIYIF